VIALALAAVLQASLAPAEDVVVLARRLRLIEVDIRAPRKDGRLVLARCRVTRPSGIAELDAVPCAAAQACVAEPIASRKALQACVEDRSGPMLDAIVAARRAARP
jgi:hypothetical protein